MGPLCSSCGVEVILQASGLRSLGMNDNFQMPPQKQIDLENHYQIRAIHCAPQQSLSSATKIPIILVSLTQPLVRQ
jgi:hypothetical protein